MIEAVAAICVLLQGEPICFETPPHPMRFATETRCRAAHPALAAEAARSLSDQGARILAVVIVCRPAPVAV